MPRNISEATDGIGHFTLMPVYGELCHMAKNLF